MIIYHIMMIIYNYDINVKHLELRYTIPIDFKTLFCTVYTQLNNL